MTNHSDPSDTAFARHHDELTIGRAADAQPLSQVVWVLYSATLTALIFGSESLARWAFDLPLWLGPLREELVTITANWHHAMTTLGPAQLHPWLHEVWQMWQTWSMP